MRAKCGSFASAIRGATNIAPDKDRWGQWTGALCAEGAAEFAIGLSESVARNGAMDNSFSFSL